MLPRTSSAVKRLPLVVVVGPTASGKSALAVALARRFGGEVISADSRQVYRELDVGSGKITRREMRGVPHHLLDVASPQRTFTVAQYQRLAQRALQQIWRRGKLPILCGGTGFYVDAVLEGTAFPPVKPNVELRQRLGALTTRELYQLLRREDPARAKRIDRRNRHRLIRALEVVAAIGSVPPVKYEPLPTRGLVLGLYPGTAQLKRNIEARLRKRLRRGMVAEVRKLHERGLSWRRLERLGLEYRTVARCLQGKLTRAELATGLQRDTWRYARRQLTWFKRLASIHWVVSSRQAEALVQRYMKSPSSQARES